MIKLASTMALALALTGCSISTPSFMQDNSNNDIKPTSQITAPKHSKLQSEYIERFGIANTAAVNSMSDTSIVQKLAQLADKVDQRYKDNFPADIFTIELSNIQYVDRPHHYTMRPMNFNISRGDTIVSHIKSDHYTQDGVSAPIRITLAENMRLYVNGVYVDQVYNHGAYEFYAKTNNRVRVTGSALVQ